MEGDIHGVRIEPRVLNFFHTVPGKIYTLTINVKNVSEKGCSIRYYGPENTKNFHLKVKNPEEPVAPGLCVPASVEYNATEETEMTDRLVVTIDDEILEVPIFTYLSCPHLELPRDVDFGTVIADSKVITKEISLINSGAKAGEFKITYNGQKHISFTPSVGSIPPNSMQIIKVEFVTKIPGKLEETLIVEMEGVEPKELTIHGNVCNPLIEILSLKDEKPIKCISFGNTYYGTDCTECALLFNNSPATLSFVAMIDESAPGQEMGIDMTSTTTGALAEEDGYNSRHGSINALTSLITTIPNQGVLQPYQKIPIFFRFSPRWNKAQVGWKSKVIPPPRKDFALFVRFEMSGSSKGFSEITVVKKKGHFSTTGKFAEVALTATALPVLLDISPSDSLDFGECPVGESVDTLCTIRNESFLLPAIFQFRRIAHFSARPLNGKISPGQTQDVVFSFVPKQVGTFKPLMLLDVLGQTADTYNPSLTNLEVISTLSTRVSGHSNPVTVVPKPRFNPGLTPYITNEVGMYVETTFADVDSKVPRNALAGSTRVHLHRIYRPKSLDIEDKKVKVAFPNDRPHSVRPSERNQIFRTPFTYMDRYNYVDPDYALTDEEILTRRSHRSYYVEHLHLIQDLKKERRRKREYKLTANETDIGLQPAAGLLPRPLKLKEIKSASPSLPPPNEEWRLLSTQELAVAEKEAMSKPVQEGLNAVPTTDKEKADCKKWLSPQNLHQIVVGPPTIEFGKVCMRSVSQKELNIINNLLDYILVEATIDSRELRQSSPLSQVVPPRSRAVIPIIFESNTKGNFQRSVTYTINGFHKNHVTVMAEVVCVGLELSTENLVLMPTLGLPADAGFRGVITLHNRLNYPAEFTWSPDIGERGTAFSIRPATGTVNTNSSLDCEVVWHPSYLAPQDGSFMLIVHGGEPLKLQCLAEMGPTSVSFVEQRIAFGSVPVNLTTTKSAFLQNTGVNHGYFQVLDPNPFPGLTVTPVHGVIPVGGVTELFVSLTPDTVLKFDAHIQIAIKGSRTVDLRMGGIVESPSVDMSVNSFNFGGVYCGCKSSISFKMFNKGNTRCKLEFDLTRYKDFSLSFPGFQTTEDRNYQIMNPGMSTITILPLQTIKGELSFLPLQVAAYDFLMPVIINHMSAPTPSATPSPPTTMPSVKKTFHQPISSQPAMLATPRKQILATALRQPLQISDNHINFTLSSSIMDKTSGCGEMKTTVLVNSTKEVLHWGLDLRQANKTLKDGIIKFVHPSGVPFISDSNSNGIEGELEPGKVMPIAVVFSPKKPGFYECQVPVVIKNRWEAPCQTLTITGCLEESYIQFDPPGVCLTPVPLLTEISCEFNILAFKYTVPTQITAECPLIEFEDGDTSSPLKVTFLQGCEIPAHKEENAAGDTCCLPCRVVFCSAKPVSFTKPIVFHDGQGHSFSMPVTATADNCILTCYPFLALHRVDHHIVREQGNGQEDNNNNDATFNNNVVIVPVHSPNRSASRPSTSATTSTFQIASSFEHSASVTESTRSTPGPREGAMNKPPTGSDFNNRQQREGPSRLGSAMFPDEDSEEGIFHVEVLLAVQRWFSAHGWPGGPFPISVPETLRNIGSKGHGRGSAMRGNTKDTKTIYDMITHLSGQSVPGIPVNLPLPADPVGRVKQLYWQHSTLLTFLKCQGGCVASIQPEYLLSAQDFAVWRQLQQEVKQALEENGQEEEAKKIHISDYMEEDIFEAVSKRAWTDILLQILKTLVLASVTLRSYKSLTLYENGRSLPLVNPDPLASNIYSISERILLVWLNHYYETYRHKIWKNSKRGDVPSSRWIVNYDYDLLDGLVLGALLGAYMPFVIESHLEGMYTHPTSAEQCLHNAIKVVNAMRYAGIDYDVQAIDITDPNPIMMLLLVAYLYQILPSFLPKTNLEFIGPLHSTVTRQVKISNPTTKPLTYQVLLAGQDANDFRVPKGNIIVLSARQVISLSVEFTSRFLRPAKAVLVLVSTHQNSSTISVLTFNLCTQINSITPMKGSELTRQITMKVESPCYELQRVMLNVKSPFKVDGAFRVVLIESSGDLLDSTISASQLSVKEKKLKKIRSKIDHGQAQSERLETSFFPKFTNTQNPNSLNNEDNSQKLSAFFTDVESVYLKPDSSVTVEVNFLPFSLGEHQCSVVFINETAGEFLYLIEAKATLPLPSPLPYMPSPCCTQISSTATGDDVVSFKCKIGQELKETLYIPVNNIARERALSLAAQQPKEKQPCMSDVELQRRNLTGTLRSSSVTSKAMKMLATNPQTVIQKAKQSTVYTVECDSENFKFPETITMPSPLEARSYCPPSNLKVPKGVKLYDGVVELPVEFYADEAGVYPCQITLKSDDDIRIYYIECSIVLTGTTAELVFTTAVMQSTSQDIPIVNTSNYDWTLVAELTGEFFCGPSMLIAKANQKTCYPLVFRPFMERTVQGKLVLKNIDNDAEFVFSLTGKATKPLQIDNIKLKMEAKDVLNYTIKVPNKTHKKLVFKVESDLPFLTGPRTVTVLPRQTSDYEVTIYPSHHGHFMGILSFTAGEVSYREIDSDGEEVPEDDVEEFNGYQIWFAMDITVHLPPPESTLRVSCHCHKKMLIEIIVRNPTPEKIVFTSKIEGRGLTGPTGIELDAGEMDVFAVTFAPIVLGRCKGSITFFNQLVGEFWYKLDLEGLPPAPTTLPPMECELGRWSEQTIVLQNPTDETLELVPTVSNSNNFTLQRESDRPLILKPRASIEVMLHFMPSGLGQGDHSTKISFHSHQLGEWIFLANGTGLPPKPQEPMMVTSKTGTNSTIIIPFRNPLNTDVMARISLKDSNIESAPPLGQESEENPSSPFSLLLKNIKGGVHVGPKCTLDIPISFAPLDLQKHDCLCIVSIIPEKDVSSEDNQSLFLSPKPYEDKMKEIQWIYPVHGIPDINANEESCIATMNCKARSTIRKKVEVSLVGAVPSAASEYKVPSYERSSSKHGSQSIVVTETLETADEFSYKLTGSSNEIDDILLETVRVSLVKQQRDDSTGLVTLLFSITFKPFKSMNCLAYLHVTGALGGMWKFPIHFVASEPPVDDVISLECTGIGKSSSVAFKMYSQNECSTPFNAYLIKGSHKEFCIEPQNGELLPKSLGGTLLTLTFKPVHYGKPHRTKLIVKTNDMQWSYNVQGLLPEYMPPSGHSSVPMARPQPDPLHHKEPINYIVKNKQLLITGVSSPIKGAPLMKINQVK